MIEFICGIGFSARLIATALTTFILASCAIPPARRCALRFRIIAAPNPDFSRKSGVPILGGLPIIVSALLAVALFGKLPLWALIGATGLMLVGMIDDAITLRPSSKLVCEAVLVAAAMLFFPPVKLTPWPVASVALASFFILATVNAYNLIDGLDGLAAGIGICSALSIAAIATGNRDSLLAIQSLAVGGALAGFLVFNRYPATIFMGDCGALPLGFLLGAMALRGGAHAAQSLPIACAIPLLIMLVPLLDMVTVTMGRVSRDAPITRRGLDHSHHKLLALGFSETSAVRVCWSVAALAAASAVFLARCDSRLPLLILPSIATVFAILAMFVVDLKVEVSPQVSSRIGHHHLIGNFWRTTAGIGCDGLMIIAAYFDAFLLRRGPSLESDGVAALITNVPLVLLIAYPSFVSFGLYRAPARRFDSTRLASAAAAAGISLLLASYVLPLMVSGVIVLVFVMVLFGLLALSRVSTEIGQSSLAFVRRPRPVSSTYVQATAFVAALEGEESTSEAAKSSRKVMAQ